MRDALATGGADLPGADEQIEGQAVHPPRQEQTAVLEQARHGIEGLTLRGVAKRADVSHAVPAHHFGDANGLLTALAARGFERLLARQQDFQRQAPPEPRAQMEAIGAGYVNFALESPALFRLMFGSDRTDCARPRHRRHPHALTALKPRIGRG